MEKWVLEKGDFGLLEIFFLTIKLLTLGNKNFILESTFHYSMCEAKTPSLNKPLYFQ